MKKKISIKNEMEEIERVQSLVDEIAEEMNFPDKLIFNINLILDEILTNIISYGYKDDNEHIINLLIGHEGDEITLSIEDDGFPFNPLEMPPPPLDETLEARKIGGVGIYLVIKLVKSINYRRWEDKNILSMSISKE